MKSDFMMIPSKEFLDLKMNKCDASIIKINLKKNKIRRLINDLQ